MGQPAARIGDSTAHGGTIVVGFPTVLIGGMPAARMGDMHVCPMVNPGVPPPPHVGGPIMKGSATVLIGGQPAARMGDMCTCAGPPDSIVIGCPTVLIGDGAGSGGGGGGGAAKAAQDAAAGALQAQSQEGVGSHWVDYTFTDAAGNPVTGVKYDFTLPDGSIRKGVLTGDGGVRAGGLPDEGESNVVLYKLFNAKWSKDHARVDEELVLSAQTDGYTDGTPAVIEIYARTGSGIDIIADELSTQVQGGKIEERWKYRGGESDSTDNDEIAMPEYYFLVHVGTNKVRSGILSFQDWIEIMLDDEDGKPVPDEDYRIILATGEVRTGRLNAEGYAREERIPPGGCQVEFLSCGETLWLDENESSNGGRTYG